ncbi:hypothetical protein H5410_002218 [Solanum commersonii]|uniref:Uncharacterized protein n=1 Tax=Solanum commersonii TaxID=4109 RepID=A0A9J6B134_SOLCO|nr:hypothetical protein H5410_002218 [Solanum commersonii]
MTMDFSDRDAPYPFLEIMQNKQHSRTKVLTLKVHAPIIGTFALVKKMLDTFHHLPEWSSTKMKDVTDNFSGNVTTEKVLLLKSFTHQNVVVAIPPRCDENLSSWHVPSSGFCEDFCENWRPSTNTVSTFVEELSISLWDLRTIGGLPVHGFFYDEVIPSAKELTHVDDQGKSFLPRSAIDEVSFREWTKFWFRGPRNYVQPSPRMSKNRMKPRINHDPSGNIDMSFFPRTEEENALLSS